MATAEATELGGTARHAVCRRSCAWDRPEVWRSEKPDRIPPTADTIALAEVLCRECRGTVVLASGTAPHEPSSTFLSTLLDPSPPADPPSATPKNADTDPLSRGVQAAFPPRFRLSMRSEERGTGNATPTEYREGSDRSFTLGAQCATALARSRCNGNDEVFFIPQAGFWCSE